MKSATDIFSSGKLNRNHWSITITADIYYARISNRTDLFDSISCWTGWWIFPFPAKLFHEINALLINGYGVTTRLRWQLQFQIKFYLAYVYFGLNLNYMRSEAVNNLLVDGITSRSLKYYQNTFLVFNAFAIS